MSAPDVPPVPRIKSEVLASAGGGVAPAVSAKMDVSSGVAPATVPLSVTSHIYDASMGETAVESEPSAYVVCQASDRTGETADVANVEATFMPQAQADLPLEESEDAMGVKFPPLEAVVAVVVS